MRSSTSTAPPTPVIGPPLSLVLATLALAVAALGCGDDGATALDAGMDASTVDAGPVPGDATAGDASADAGATTPPFRVALSVSPFTSILLRAGLRYDDGVGVATTLAELEAQLRRHGATEVYTRISTERVEVGRGGEHSLDSALERAQIAVDMGLPLNPELALVGSYGDVSCQTPPDFTEYPDIVPPGAWETLTVDQMVPLLRAFAADVARELLATGVTVEVWDLGNEVDLGTAGVAPQPLPGACDDEAGGPGWYRAPDAVDPAIGAQSVQALLTMSESARIAWLEMHVWPHVARLLAAAAEGVRSVVPGARIATHVSGVSATPLAAPAFYRAMAAGGLDLDVLGFSFYPSAGPGADRLGGMRTMVEALGAELGKPVFMAEVAYPAGLVTTGAFAGWDVMLPGYPLDGDGQALFLRNVASWGASGALSGMRPWGPELAVTGWDPFALYTVTSTTARPRPGLDAIREGVASPDPGAI